MVAGSSKIARDFGKAPVGPVPIARVQVDTNKGIILEKFSDYKMASAAKPAGKIGRFHLLPIPDPGTQMAQLLSDGVDAIKEPEVTQVADLLKDPRFTSYVDQRIAYVYMAIDAMGVAGNKALADVRVRKALFLAIDRNATTKMSVDDAPIPPVKAMCWKPQQSGCDYTVELPEQNIPEAKRLLAEADTRMASRSKSAAIPARAIPASRPWWPSSSARSACSPRSTACQAGPI